MSRAVVFAYNDVGVRCLSVLLAHGMDIPLVVTHQNDPNETVWFDSVAELADLHELPTITPDDPNAPEVIESVRAARPDFLFSFYYRHMLGAEILEIPSRGAYNMHGSLLPDYRGRVPVNWAVLRGESRTGASLHRMVAKPDAGDLVAQQAVPILPNDTAVTVFRKVTCAAECCLTEVLPALDEGRAKHVPLDLAAGSYFGRRRPEDGRIDWSQSAWTVHNLIRAVAPPFPGAFFDQEGRHVCVLSSHFRGEDARAKGPRLYVESGRIFADAADGVRFQILALTVDGREVTAENFTDVWGAPAVALPAS
ncbi:MAG: formyltransferase [Gammaproteobacteria bacterium]